eukprot:3255370-Amphidinium_carterae.1
MSCGERPTAQTQCADPHAPHCTLKAQRAHLNPRAQPYCYCEKQCCGHRFKDPYTVQLHPLTKTN